MEPEVIIVVIVVVALTLFLIWGVISDIRAKWRYDKKREIELKNAVRQREIEAKTNKKAFNEKYADLGAPTIQIFFCNKWGRREELTRENSFKHFGGVNYITVWKEHKLFLISSEYSSNFEGIYTGGAISSIDNVPDHPLSFDTLISCEVTDDLEVRRGDGHSVTKTSKLGMLTRGAVGGALFGGVGVLAGAMTANTTTETTFDSDEVTHNYKIHLTLNDFSCPIVTLPFGKNEDDMRKVLSVLNLIIKNS